MDICLTVLIGLMGICIGALIGLGISFKINHDYILGMNNTSEKFTTNLLDIMKNYFDNMIKHEENYFINSLLYKKKYICKENWYGGKVRKLYSRSTSWLSGYSLRRFRGW